MDKDNICARYMIVALDKAGSMSRLAEEVGIPRQTLTQWLNGERSPSFDKFYAVLKYIDADIARVGQETIRSMRYSDIPVASCDAPPIGDYIAVPVVKDPDLLEPDDFFIPASNLHAVTLSVRGYKTAKGRPHQVGTIIRDEDMLPLLEPGDIVYADRADTVVKGHRNLYLVRDAVSGRVMVRRVEEQIIGDDTWLHFYADSVKVSPVHYSIKKHYNGNRRTAILGRVIWGRIELLDL